MVDSIVALSLELRLDIFFALSVQYLTDSLPVSDIAFLKLFIFQAPSPEALGKLSKGSMHSEIASFIRPDASGDEIGDEVAALLLGSQGIIVLMGGGCG